MLLTLWRKIIYTKSYLIQKNVVICHNSIINNVLHSVLVTVDVLLLLLLNVHVLLLNICEMLNLLNIICTEVMHLRIVCRYRTVLKT